MSNTQELETAAPESATQPFFYEVRVRGRLSNEQWTAWFSNLTVSTTKGESVLRGTLPDHAALYGLLARLRDLAVPLLSVNVLDAEAQRKMRQQSRRYDLLINGLLLVIYLTLVGGIVAVTTFLTSGGLNTALALAGLFAILGALALIFSLWSAQPKAWRWLAYGSWVGSIISFLIYTAVGSLLSPAISISIMLFLGAGGLIYLLSYLRGRAKRVNNVIVDWEALGSRTDSADKPGE